MVEKPERLRAAIDGSKDVGGEVRPLEMLRPCRGELIESLVQRVELGDLAFGQLALNRDDEVDVAVLVEVSNGEGALDVSADERVIQRHSDPVDELS